MANVNRKRDELRACYEASLLEDDSVGGTMTLALEFGEDREPSALGVTSEMPEAMNACVANAIPAKAVRLVAGEPGQAVQVELRFRR